LAAGLLSIVTMMTGCGGGAPAPADAVAQLQAACQSMLAAATSADVQRGIFAFEQVTVATEHAAATLLLLPPNLRPTTAEMFQATMKQFEEQYKLLPNSRDFMRAVRDRPAYDELDDRIDSAADLIKEWARRSPPSMKPQLGSHAAPGQEGSSRGLAAKQQARGIAQILYLYLVDQGQSSIPEGFDLFELVPDYLTESDILDPWGEPFMVIAPGDANYDFDVVSFGADRAPGGFGEDEDITN